MAVIEICLSILLGGIFFSSAIPKLLHPKGFVLVVLEYRILPASLSQLYGWALPPLEFLLALLLIGGTDIRISSIILSLLLFSFMIAVSVNIARGRDLNCNCFGTRKQRKIGWPLLFQDSLLFCLAVLLAIISPNWAGLESWSLFRLPSQISVQIEHVFALLLCASTTVSTTSLLGKIRKRLLLPK